MRSRRIKRCKLVLGLQNSFTPTVVGSTADMASPLPLQHANTMRYVGNFSSQIWALLITKSPFAKRDKQIGKIIFLCSEYSLKY
jgi:hypothetical protein